MTNRTKAALAALAAAALAACAHPHPRPAPEVNVMQTQEWKGAHGGPLEPGTAVAVDAASWNKLWRDVGQAPPDLDLEKFVGVAVYLGRRPTGGWRASFAAASRGDDLVVRWRVVKPGGFVAQVLTEPWAVQAFPRPKGRVVVEAAPE
jgi:hypothetical protein